MTPPRPVSAHPAVAAFAALAVALTWLLSTLINQVMADIGTGSIVAGLGTLLPGTGPSWVGASEAPWQYLVPAAAALALGAILWGCLETVLGWLHGVGRAPTFLVVWACAVAAAALLGGLLVVGGIVVDWPPARWAFLFRDVQPQVGAGAYWALVWGWVPAWVGVFVERRHPARRPSGATWSTGVLHLLPAVVFAVVLVATIPLATEANRGAVPVPVASEPAPAPVPIGHPTVSYAIEMGAPGSAHPVGGQWCAGDGVSTVLAGADAATGHRAQQLRITNSSSTACRLGNYPDVAFDDAGGNAMNVLFYRGGSFMTRDPGPAEVVLQPGESATAMLGWNAAPAGATTPGTILIAPYAGAERTRLRVGAEPPAALDIVDGGAVAITAWAAAD